MSDVAPDVAATRETARLFALSGDAYQRGLIEVTGGDAERWLDGMLTNDITQLDAAGRTGCYAAVLTPKGRIIADLHVLARPDGYWLETAASAVPTVLERLDRYIVADDVKLTDRSGEFARLALEGPDATSRLAAAAAQDAADLGAVAPECWATLDLGGEEDLVAARFGWSGEDAWQLFVPVAAEAAVRAAVAVPVASVEALDVLRVESGVPRLGPELDEGVFPDEARLDTAISRTKGCYTGQEIVARLYSRGAVNHLLVRLRFEGGAAPALDAPLLAEGKKTGEVTSACVSPTQGPIGLGYVRREHSEPGTVVQCGGVDATVVQ